MTIRSSVLGFVLVVFGLGAFHPAIHAAPQPPPLPPPAVFGGSGAQAPQTGTAAISGGVVDAITKGPLSGAEVSLSGRGVNVNVLTDGKGRFVFLDLPAGPSYTMSASKAGYFDGRYGDRNARTGKPIALADGQWIADLRIELLRPSSIGGTTVDESGDPVVGAYVRILTMIPVAGRPHLAVGRLRPLPRRR